MIDAAKPIEHSSRFLRSSPVRGMFGDIGIDGSAGSYSLSRFTLFAAPAAGGQPQRLPSFAAACLRAHAGARSARCVIHVNHVTEFEGGGSVSALNNPFRSGRVAV